MTVYIIQGKPWKVRALTLSVITALHVGGLLWFGIGKMEPTVQVPKHQPIHLQFIHIPNAQALSKVKSQTKQEKVAVLQAQPSPKKYDRIHESAAAQNMIPTYVLNEHITHQAANEMQAIDPIKGQTELSVAIKDTQIVQDAENVGHFDIKNYHPIEKVEPIYPEQALQHDLEGSCTVVYNVNELGSVAQPKADGDCPAIFVTPSVNAVLNFKYEPYMLDGRASTVQNVRYTFQYQISKSS